MYSHKKKLTSVFFKPKANTYRAAHNHGELSIHLTINQARTDLITQMYKLTHANRASASFTNCM